MQANVWNILDTCAFFSQTHPSEKLVTVNGIETEIKNKQSLQYFRSLLNKGLELLEPSLESLAIIEQKARETGDLDVLSKIDMKILALGHQLGGTIVTDDFAVQNVSLGLKLEDVTCSGKKIDELRNWKYRCSGCGNISERKSDVCGICGNKEIFRIKTK